MRNAALSDSFNPYAEWLGLEATGSTPDFYTLLGLQPFESDGKIIREASARAMTRVRGFRPGAHARQWAALLDELELAQRTLVDPVEKDRYDKLLRAGLHAEDGMSSDPSHPSDLYSSSTGVVDMPQYPASPSSSGNDPLASTAGKAGNSPSRWSEAPPSAPIPLTPSMHAVDPPAGESPGAAAGTPSAQLEAQPTPQIPVGSAPVAVPTTPAPITRIRTSGPVLPFVAGFFAGVSVMAVIALVVLLGTDMLQQYAMRGKEYPTPSPAPAPAPVTGAPANASVLPNPSPGQTPGPVAQPVKSDITVPDTPVEAPPAVPTATDVTTAPPADGTTPATPEVAVTPPDKESLPDPFDQEFESAPPTIVRPATGSGSQGTELPLPGIIESGATGTDVVGQPQIKKPQTAKDVRELNIALKAARQALGKREFKQTLEKLAAAEALASTPEQQAAVRRLKLVSHYVNEFWGAVGDGLKSLKAMQELRIKENLIVIVEASEDHLVFRSQGRNYRYLKHQIPGALALEIADLWLDSTKPSSKIITGAFIFADPHGKNTEAELLWQQAALSGVAISDILPVLKDKYDFTFKRP